MKKTIAQTTRLSRKMRGLIGAQKDSLLNHCPRRQFADEGLTAKKAE